MHACSERTIHFIFIFMTLEVTAEEKNGQGKELGRIANVAYYLMEPRLFKNMYGS
jgi:hypothetical protein